MRFVFVGILRYEMLVIVKREGDQNPAGNDKKKYDRSLELSIIGGF